MQSILILSLSPIARDPRVMRQVTLLEHRFKVTVAGFGPDPGGNFEFHPLAVTPSSLPVKLRWGAELLLGMSETYYWSRPEIRRAVESLELQRFDLVLVNDIAALPLGVRLARGAPVLVDAHEYSPAEFEDRPAWRLLFGRHYRKLCRKYLPRAAAMTTVCEGIADEYQKNFGVSASVIENTPPRQDLSPRNVLPDRIRMVHHGAAIRSRRLELMIDVVKHADPRFTLDFMLVGSDTRYVEELRKRASGDDRVRFLPPVAMPDICKETNQYDIGLFLLPPVNFNYRYALPNKLFEFIQARLAVAIGPSPEMARVVRKHKLGVVAESFEPAALAGLLNGLTVQDLTRFKRAADVAANQLCFETAAERLLSLVQQLLGAAGTKLPRAA